MDQPTKASLRARARSAVASLSREERAAASAEICRRIEALPEWAEARTIGLYAAQDSEPDLAWLLDARGKRFCFPRVEGKGIEFLLCEGVASLRPGQWGLREPDPEHWPVVAPADLDLIFVPGLAFGRDGVRLGRGGGYYDRYLAGMPARTGKIGVCFHAQLMPELPREAHDHAVDGTVTELEMLRCRG